MQAFAQSTPPSLPSLPALPGVPQPAASPPAISMPALPSVPQTLTPASPSAAVAPLPGTANAGTATKGSETPPTTTDLPDYATPPEPADTTALPTPTPVAGGLPPLGGLPPISGIEIPGAPPAASTALVPSPSELFGDGNALTIPEIRVVREKAPLKTWQTKLAPAIIPPKTNFIYKRELLPEAIYRSAYGKENRHLPARATREQYEWLMFTSIAKNDVETTRSLLNAGTSLKAINMYGETPLMFAERTGARDVAALIQARGGR